MGKGKRRYGVKEELGVRFRILRSNTCGHAIILWEIM